MMGLRIGWFWRKRFKCGWLVDIMKNIKVHIQYPLKVSDSQYYRSMIDNPPKGVEFVGSNKTGMVVNKNKFKGFDNFKRVIKFILNKIPLPIPNAHYTKSKGFDLIHCAHCLSRNENKPWVLDVESLWQLWISGRGERGGREAVLKYLMRNNCKKIIAWTEATKADIMKAFPEVADKVEVVYYGMRMPKLRKKKKNKDITLFFSGRHFYAKGGLNAVEVMNRLTKKYGNVRGVINGVIPNEVREEYSGNKKLKFYGLMPYGEILKLYRDADIFVYPGYSDTLGFVFMDAMAYGVPIVTINGHARREVVEDGVTGFVIDMGNPADISRFELDEKIISELYNKTSLLIENEKLRKKMSKQCIDVIENGKFSIKTRNAKLGRIYREALG